MGDGSAVFGWVLAAAVVTVLAGGVAANGSTSGTGGGTSGSDTSARTANRTTTGTSKGSTTGTTTGTTTARTGTSTGATLDASTCTRVGVIRSADGKQYHQFPVTAGGSALCLLERGARGTQVRVLQQALALCSKRSVPDDGVYEDRTRTAIVTQQRTRPGQLVDGIYGPLTATLVRWPWLDATTGKFTGSCARMGDRSL
jgi:hypothetical protein